MTKRQFMEGLRSSLEGMVSQAVIQENMNYYEDYINEQIRNGKNEQDVLNELGSPRLIARSIIDAKGEDDDYVQTGYYEEEQDEGTPEDMFGGNTHIFTMNSTKFKLGCLLSVIIFIFIIYLLFHIFSAMMVVLGPVIIIGVIVALIVAWMVRKSFRLAKEITHPISCLSENVRKVGHGNFEILPVETNVIEVKNLDQGIQKMARRIQTLLENVKEEERKQHMTQLELLQAQVSPHFLYNTLDTIVWMVEADMHDEAIEMLTHLSMFFRTALSKGEDVISLFDEVLHTKSYLEIQQIRYSDILEYSIDLPEEFEMISLPKLTLQPLVENALYHGVKEKRGQSKITITFDDAGDDIIIQVLDDGIGMKEERLQEVKEGLKQNNNVGFGLAAVQGRLVLYFGAGYGIDIWSKYGEGTRIRVRIPKKFNFLDKKI